MKIFNFDPADHAARYARTGWVHIPGGIDPEFLAHLKDFTQRRFREQHVEGKAIGGAKEQALFEFPEDTDFPGELFDSVAAVAGLDRPGMTLSERHIKAYDSDAPDFPVAHKDRFASQVSVGLSIDIPDDSYLVLYPHTDVSVNPYNVSPQLLASLEPHQRPEVVLADAPEIRIDDKPGDVVMFAGSATWHLRRFAANATNLYLKMNDFNSDPLGEDPSTEPRQRRTLELLASSNGHTPRLVPVLARRLDVVARQRSRDGQEVLHAHVWEETPVVLSQVEWDLVHAIDGSRSLEQLAEVAGGAEAADAAIRRLAQRGVIELVG
ncbi:MAG: hypothetical protein QOE06_847 [Thermoleophilaceae bacterium]|jgi:hypothetical protein|nr:hypothetical protein [Thermoleophilaceae bacterium]